MHLKVLFMPNLEQQNENLSIKKTNETNQAVPKYRLLLLAFIGLIVGMAVIIFIFIFKGIPLSFIPNRLKPREWTGFGESQDEITVTEKSPDGKPNKITTTRKKQPGKKLWDWLSLLGVPLTLAILGYYFQYQQNKAREAKENQDKERAADQQRESALQAYFNELSVLLIDKGLFEKLSGTIEDPTKEAMLSVITAKTRTMLKIFGEDIPRKAAVLLFLGDSSLLKQNLLNLNLSYINLTKAYLVKADLSKAILLKADLTGANLLIANLNEAILTETILTDADLRGADLTGVILIKAKLNGAELNGANLYQANLTGAIFEGAKELTHKQIKSACFWDKAIYTEARWDDKKRIWVVIDPQANEETIKKIREDTASDPQTPPDCSIWNNT